MDKEQFYQMRLHRDIFESQNIQRNTDFSFKVIDNNNPLHIRDNISDLSNLVIKVPVPVKGSRI